MGPTGGVSTGHPLTTAAAFSILLKGGNAFDAGVASLIAGGVLEQDLYSLGGEALVLVYPKKENKVTSIVGQGWAPKAVDVDWYLSRKKTLDGAGLDPAVVPGALHAALTVLEKWGTMSFEEVAAPGIGYAENGFPMRNSTAQAIQRQLKFFESWPDNKTYWLKPDGSQYKPGETIKLPALARTLHRMVDAERGAKAKGRDAGIVAARDRFYKGDIAAEMVAFLQKNGAPFDASDFAEYYARIEEPAKTTYRGYTVYKHGFGSQGPVLLQALNILENFDLHAMGYASADYLHTVTEALEARVCGSRFVLRRSRLRAGAWRRLVVEGVRQGARGADRSEEGVDLLHRRRSDEVRFEGQAVDVLEGERRRRRYAAHAQRPGREFTGGRQGHDPHGRHRQGRQHLRRDAERRMGAGRGDPRRHRHRHERARRAVLARQDARQPDSPAGAAALHADAEHGVQGRHADDGPRHARAATTRIKRSCRRCSASWTSGTTGIPTCTPRSSVRACRRCISTDRSGRTQPASIS